MNDKQAMKLRRNDVLHYCHPFGHGNRSVKLIRKFPKSSQALVQDLEDSRSYEMVSYLNVESIPVVISIWMAGWKKKNSKRAQLVWDYERKIVDTWIEKANKEKNIEWVTPIFEHVLPPQ